MASTLTPSAMEELTDLLKLSRRFLAEVYREYRLGATAEAIAEARNQSDPRRIEELLSALRVLFGRQALPKKGEGRQAAINEALFWVNSDAQLSEELHEHFNKILALGKRTNQRINGYIPPEPVFVREEQRKRRRDGADGRQAGVYVLTRGGYYRDNKPGEPLLMKIGYSDSVWERIESSRAWFHDEVIVLRVFPVENPRPIELKFQIVLDSLGLNVKENGGTEWFKAELSLIDSIASALSLYDVAQHKEAP